MMKAAVRIGRKRTGGKLAVHMAIHGETCSTARPVNVETNVKSAHARLCKNCFTPARIARAQQANNYGRSFNAVAAEILAEVVELSRTPEERAASAAKFAQTQYARDIAAAAAAPPYRHRTFAEIRAALNPTTVDPDQLALLPAAA